MTKLYINSEKQGGVDVQTKSDKMISE